MEEEKGPLQDGLRAILTGTMKGVQKDPAVRVPEWPKKRLSVLD